MKMKKEAVPKTNEKSILKNENAFLKNENGF